MAQFGIKSYWKPTPKIFRKIGDAMLGASGAMVAYVATLKAFDLPLDPFLIKLATYGALVGIIGKFITNFIGEQSLNDQAKGL